MKNLLALCLLACTALPAQQIPSPTQLPGHTFFVKKTWIVGGLGNWDYLTMDPKANQLFIAHGALVQVVDVTTGAVAGQITGLREAHAIALDDAGEFGYVSDGLADDVKVFDRRSLQVVASIPTGPNPRALVFEPQNKLVFAICTNPLTQSTPEQPAATQPTRPAGADSGSSTRNRPTPPVRELEIKASITVIDVETRQPVAQILMPGKMGFAQTDGDGQVFVIVVDRNQIARLNAQAIGALIRNHQDRAAPSQPGPTKPTSSQSGTAVETHAPMVLDWSHESRPAQSAQDALRLFPLDAGCLESRSLAIDHSHQRLFAACNNLKMSVLNALTGELVASLPTGPGTDAVGFDPDRGLIYSANGGANGSLTIIRQDVTDSYAVIQNLPTRQRARTLAVNPSTGEVYLVTDLLGVNLAQPGGIGTLHTAPANGSFQVLVVGN
jgi:DNA-binding beta-propeller fold protein YncE